MNEEFLAKQETDLYWFMGVAVVIVVLHLIGYLSSKKLSPKNRKIRIKKFQLASLCVLTVYLFLSIPYTGFYYDFGKGLEYPKELKSQEETVKYIKDYHHRIEDLERGLEEARTETRMLRDHYKNLLYLIMIFVLSYSGGQIFGTKIEKDLEEIDSSQISKL